MAEFSFNLTDWKRSVDSPVEVCQAFGNVWLKSKGGRYLLAYYLLNAVITEKEALSNAKHMKSLRAAKERNLRDSWVDSMKQVIGRRMGVKGYRGYFTITEVLPYYR